MRLWQRPFHAPIARPSILAYPVAKESLHGSLSNMMVYFCLQDLCFLLGRSSSPCPRTLAESDSRVARYAPSSLSHQQLQADRSTMGLANGLTSGCVCVWQVHLAVLAVVRPAAIAGKVPTGADGADGAHREDDVRTSVSGSGQQIITDHYEGLWVSCDFVVEGTVRYVTKRFFPPGVVVVVVVSS